MNSDTLLVIIIVMIIALPIVSRVIGGMLTSPKILRLGDDVPDPERWLPEAAEKSATAFSSVSWESSVYVTEGSAGEPSEYVGVISGAGGRYRVEVRAPKVGFGGSVSAASVQLTDFSYRSSPVNLIFLGKYPDNVAVAARSRVIRKVKRHARRAAKQRTVGSG